MLRAATIDHSGLRVLLTAFLSLTTSAVLAQGSGDPLDLTSMRRDFYELQLSSAFGSGVVPGAGVDMQDPYFPKEVPFSPFVGPPLPQSQIISGADVDSNKVTVSTAFRDQLSVDEEASIIAASFRASFLVGSAQAAFHRVQESRRTGRAVYFFYSISGESRAAQPAKIVWPTNQLAGVEAVDDSNLRMRTFIGRFGSHYVLSVQYGARLAIRAELKTLDESKQRDLSAKVNLALGKFAAGGSLSQSERESLSSSEIIVTAELTAGGVQPSAQNVVLTSLEQVAQFLNDFKVGRVKLIAGPVTARIVGYWPTLDPKVTPKLYADLAPSVRTPAPAPYGVPPGTIIAWSPRAGDIVSTSSGQRILAPDGWVLCDGTAECPDLRDRFIRGTTAADQLRKETGQATFKPTGVARFSHYEQGEINFARNQGRPDPFARVHKLDVSPVPLIPPAVYFVYIMKK